MLAAEADAFTNQAEARVGFNTRQFDELDPGCI